MLPQDYHRPRPVGREEDFHFREYEPWLFPDWDAPLDKRPDAVKVGVWKDSGEDAVEEAWPLGYTVYMLRDRLGYMHRQLAGVKIVGHLSRAFCAHEYVDYLPQYQDLSKEEVDAAVLTLLEEWEGPIGSKQSTARPAATGSTAAPDTQRRAPGP